MGGRLRLHASRKEGWPPHHVSTMGELPRPPVAMMEDPPLRCVVGTDAYAAINSKLDTYRESIKKFEKLSNSTDVDGYKPPQ